MHIEAQQAVNRTGFQTDMHGRLFPRGKLGVSRCVALMICAPFGQIGIAGGGVVVLVGREVGMQIERRPRR